jgi:hypothetical protein
MSTLPASPPITGRKRKDLLGLAWMDFTHPDDLQADHDQMARLIAGEIPYFQMDKRYLRPDGEEIWIGMTVAPVVTEAGAPRRHISMIQGHHRGQADAGGRPPPGMRPAGIGWSWRSTFRPGSSTNRNCARMS